MSLAKQSTTELTYDHPSKLLNGYDKIQKKLFRYGDIVSRLQESQLTQEELAIKQNADNENLRKENQQLRDTTKTLQETLEKQFDFAEQHRQTMKNHEKIKIEMFEKDNLLDALKDEIETLKKTIADWESDFAKEKEEKENIDSKAKHVRAEVARKNADHQSEIQSLKKFYEKELQWREKDIQQARMKHEEQLGELITQLQNGHSEEVQRLKKESEEREEALYTEYSEELATMKRNMSSTSRLEEDTHNEALVPTKKRVVAQPLMLQGEDTQVPKKRRLKYSLKKVGGKRHGA